MSSINITWHKIKRTALLVVLLLVFINCLFITRVDGQRRQLKENTLRFHVRANSDRVEDQELKLKVKNATVGYMEELLKNCNSCKECYDVIEANISGILQIAYETVKALGYDYPVYGYMTYEYFPIKTYGDVCMPAGCYKAFRIDIGQGCGKNWWCSLYPRLCFVDVTCAVVRSEDKEELLEIIEDNDMMLVDSLEFKYLKFLNKWLE